MMAKMKKQTRFTMLMPAMAASPNAPAATLRAMVEAAARPWRESEGVPPMTISFSSAKRGEKRRRSMGRPPFCRAMQSNTTKLHAWLTTVAHAAPLMPSPRPKMSSGSSTTLSTAPVRMPYMAKAALPWKRIWLLRVSEAVVKGAPNSTMPRYFSV